MLAQMTATPPPLEPSLEQAEGTPAPTPPPEVQEKERVVILDTAQIRTLFTGTPHFSITVANGRFTPTVSYPWHGQPTASITSDSVPLTQPAFSAVTMHKHQQDFHHPLNNKKTYPRYDVEVVEVPDMLSAQGIEPGSVGFAHFLELPKADALVGDLEQSRSSLDLQTARNKELMQTNPERIGIRPVGTSLIYDRLIEFHDLYKGLQESPEHMTSFCSSSGDLYANLFSKFLTPPGYDGSTDDPTGLQVQIVALLKILRLDEIWYDFSLVEWRIRLGQVLWSDPQPALDFETQPLWSERDILLLQVTLSCELLIRLDAVATMDAKNAREQAGVGSEPIQDFLHLKTKKIDWDLVLARRFLDNIKVVMDDDEDAPAPVSRARALLNMWNGSTPDEPQKPNIVLLPQHQVRQLSGLLNFAETIRWPNLDKVLEELAQKLGLLQNPEKSGQAFLPDARLLDPNTPSSISVYGTPLQTPRSVNFQDGYFGRLSNHTLSHNNPRSLRMPLSPPLELIGDDISTAMNNVGGWLSRSYLTGLVLPGEAISHFLISTILENDKLAIAALGDCADLYGGFIYSDRTWWSKSSIVGRVLACLEGAVECMGWISFQTLPAGIADGWIAIHSEQLPPVHPLRITAEEDLVAQDSAVIPEESQSHVRPEDLTLPLDAEAPPTLLIDFSHWELTPLNSDLLDVDVTPGLPIENDVHVPSITFTMDNGATSHTLTLSYDVQFITSWPCRLPASTVAPAPVVRHVATRSIADTVSRASSKRSETPRLSRRSSHGYEPLLSHPPCAPDITPQRAYAEDEQDVSWTKPSPMNAHPLHASYKYKLAPATAILDADFVTPFSITGSSLLEKKVVLILDARHSADLQLLARAWCAEKGLHAIIGRVGRTCLACCVREARGLGVNVVIRV